MLKDYPVMDLSPDDMPSFLNDLANECFADNFDIRMQLSQCSIYLSSINYFLKKTEGNK